jgi:hypothetical protein
MSSPGWNAAGTDGVRTSAGAGVSLFWNMLHVDAMRGLNQGHWELDLGLGRSTGNVR